MELKLEFAYHVIHPISASSSSWVARFVPHFDIECHSSKRFSQFGKFISHHHYQQHQMSFMVQGPDGETYRDAKFIISTGTAAPKEEKAVPAALSTFGTLSRSI